MGQAALTTALIFDRTLRLVRTNAVRVLIATTLTTVPAIVAGLGMAGTELFLLANILTIAMQYWLTSSILKRLDLHQATGPRFPAFFMLALITGVAVLLGFVLLVVPGFYLLARWSVAVPAVVAANVRIAEAMRYSWQATEHHVWPIVLAFVIVYAPMILVAGLGYMLELQGSVAIGVTVTELSISLGIIAGWHVAVAIYAELNRDRFYSEVFD